MPAPVTITQDHEEEDGPSALVHKSTPLPSNQSPIGANSQSRSDLCPISSHSPKQFLVSDGKLTKHWNTPHKVVKVKAHSRRGGTRVVCHERLCKGWKTRRNGQSTPKLAISNENPFGNTSGTFRRSDISHLDDASRKKAFSLRLQEMLDRNRMKI